MPETKDNDFTWADFQQRNNSELVAGFGNFREPRDGPYTQVLRRRSTRAGYANGRRSRSIDDDPIRHVALPKIWKILNSVSDR